MTWYRYKEYAPETLYHIYNRGVNKQAIFRKYSDYQLYMRKIIEFSQKYEVKILGYCLMPNHIHLLVWQEGEIPVFKFIQALHTSYSTIYNQRYNRIGSLFQDRYKQKIVDNYDYLIHLLRYIHLNPLNHYYPLPKSKEIIFISSRKDIVNFQFSSAHEFELGVFTIVDKNLVTNLVEQSTKVNDFNIASPLSLEKYLFID